MQWAAAPIQSERYNIRFPRAPGRPTENFIKMWWKPPRAVTFNSTNHFSVNVDCPLLLSTQYYVVANTFCNHFQVRRGVGLTGISRPEPRQSYSCWLWRHSRQKGRTKNRDCLVAKPEGLLWKTRTPKNATYRDKTISKEHATWFLHGRSRSIIL